MIYPYNGFLQKYIIYMYHALCLLTTTWWKRSSHEWLIFWFRTISKKSYIKYPETQKCILTLYLSNSSSLNRFFKQQTPWQQLCWLPRCHFQRAIYIHFPIWGSPWRLHFRLEQQQMKLNIGDLIKINELISIFNIHAHFSIPLV